MNAGRFVARGRALAQRLAHPLRLLRELSAPPSWDDLTVLANRYRSDKGTEAFARHGYSRIYAKLFEQRRHEPLRLLEIGLLHPGHKAWTSWTGKVASDAPSLRLWRDYFPNATLVGFDIADFTAVRIPGCTVLRGDAGSAADLAALVASTGGRFDVVIDDASHASPHQQTALAVLFPHVVPGGLYVIEDLHWQPAELERPDVPRTVDLLRRLEVGAPFDSPALGAGGGDYLAANTASVRLFDSASGSGENRDALAVLVRR